MGVVMNKLDGKKQFDCKAFCKKLIYPLLLVSAPFVLTQCMEQYKERHRNIVACKVVASKIRSGSDVLHVDLFRLSEIGKIGIDPIISDVKSLLVLISEFEMFYSSDKELKKKMNVFKETLLKLDYDYYFDKSEKKNTTIIYFAKQLKDFRNNVIGNLQCD